LPDAAAMMACNLIIVAAINSSSAFTPQHSVNAKRR
jgi:hypothetical protein